MQDVTIPFIIKIVDTDVDGIIGIDPEQKQIFKKKSIIKDKYALNEHSFEVNDLVQVTIQLIEPEDIKKDTEGKEFYCVVNELKNDGFYTKTYDGNENRFKRALWYDARGMITAPKETFARFEVGDIIKVKVEKI